MLNREQLERYNRHILLPEIGEEGQERLCAAKVLIIGAGGLGCPAGLYLAAAGVGEIGIIDFDTIDLSNLQRQILYTSGQVGELKSMNAAKRLKELNPLVNLKSYPEKLDPKKATELFPEYDLIIDGSDNFSTRYLVNDACVLFGKPLVYGSIHRFEGQVSVFNAMHEDGSRGPTYRCLFPEPPAPGSIGNCSELGVMGTLPGIIGTLQASEAIKYITGAGHILSGKLLILNLLTMEFNTLSFARRELSGTSMPASLEEFEHMNYELACNGPAGAIQEIKAEKLRAMLRTREKLFIIDVREEGEFPDDEGLADIKLPLSCIEDPSTYFPSEKMLVLFCKSGIRSKKAGELLGAKYPTLKFYSLQGGIVQWLSGKKELT